MLTSEIKSAIDHCVLCWLATVSADGQPNVSPKEIYTHFGDHQVLIANIASPQSLKNMRANAQVCVSFVDVFVQKGYQLKGEAEIVKRTDDRFDQMAAPLLKMTAGKFPFSSLTAIRVSQVKPILAPRYVLYPATTEAEQIASAMETYGVRPLASASTT